MFTIKFKNQQIGKTVDIAKELISELEDEMEEFCYLKDHGMKVWKKLRFGEHEFRYFGICLQGISGG